MTESKKLKGIVLEDDEDEDGEFEFEDQEDGDDAYAEEDKGEEEDDDMGADEFIVDSDEDEQEMISSKRKHKRRPITKDTSKNLRAPVFLSPSPDQQHLHTNSLLKNTVLYISPSILNLLILLEYGSQYFGSLTKVKTQYLVIC